MIRGPSWPARLVRPATLARTPESRVEAMSFTTGEPDPRTPPQVAGGPRRVPYGQTRRVLPLATVGSTGSDAPIATKVGIVPAGGTSLTMVPADLTTPVEADITNFTIIAMDAGKY